ncbi:SIR2 family protein [Abiotrophia defectiva]|uniref:SIR2 family protein n=1 Tax=Abiotrophia defectiva TaxID=46125 RepID=UPI0028D2DA79|nr:SIR2 family protein [Abiotrophia defectiva]
MTQKTKPFSSAKSFEKFILAVLLRKGATATDSKDFKAIDFKLESKNGFKDKDNGIEINNPVEFEIIWSGAKDGGRLETKVEKIYTNFMNEENMKMEESSKMIVLISPGIRSEKLEELEKRHNNLRIISDEIIVKWIDKYFIEYIRSQEIDRLYNSKIIEGKETKKVFIDNSVNVIRSLSNDIEKTGLAIVLGAGVSLDYGALSWKELVESFEKTIQSEDLKITNNIKEKIGATNLIHAQLYKDLLGVKKFYDRLHQSLYGKFLSNIDKIHDDKGTTLSEVAKLLKVCEEKHIVKVLTYNYDNFLEQSLDYCEMNYEVIYNEKGHINTSMPIYHVHGYLPWGKPNKENDKERESYTKSIKLTEDDYNFLYNSPYSWQIQTQLEFFRRCNCLFIGCSLTDPNIRRLLKLSKNYGKKHYALMSSEGLDYFELVIIENHFSSMGVNIIWARNYSEYPDRINDLRTKHLKN